jgi:predicted alpha/beta-hydrolase family hydrolase
LGSRGGKERLRIFNEVRFFLRGLAGLVLTTLVLTVGAAAAEPRSVLTPRGAPISVIEQIPEGPGPFPAVVLAPGTGTLNQKINDVVAAALQRRGFAVFRFEWAYYVKDRIGRPSDTDRAPEIEDLATVVALARADRRIDPSNVLVGGKSRGTIIAWRVLRADPGLKGIVQLTPVCTKEGFTPEQLYPDFGRETRPSLWIAGDDDPACEAKAFYRFIAGGGPGVRANGLRGDHGLATDQTSALAAAIAVDFVDGVVSPKAARPAG